MEYVIFLFHDMYCKAHWLFKQIITSLERCYYTKQIKSKARQADQSNIHQDWPLQTLIAEPGQSKKQKQCSHPGKELLLTQSKRNKEIPQKWILKSQVDAARYSFLAGNSDKGYKASSLNKYGENLHSNPTASFSFQKHFKKLWARKLSIVGNAFNSSTQKAEVDGMLWVKTSLGYRVSFKSARIRVRPCLKKQKLERKRDSVEGWLERGKDEIGRGLWPWYIAYS